jgi:hypothetical protein
VSVEESPRSSQRIRHQKEKRVARSTDGPINPSGLGNSFVPSLLLAVLAALLGSIFLRGGFDLHHTGLLATKLIAAEEGLIIHRDFFSQYGPLMTWTQVPFGFLGLSPIRTILVWGLTVHAVSVFFLADLGRIAPPHWSLTHGVTLLAGAVWLGLNPMWMEGYSFPWSSPLGGLLVFIGLYVFAVASRPPKKQPRHHAKAYLFVVAGWFFGLAPFARINTGAATLTVILLIGLMVLAFGNRATKRAYSLALFGSSLGVATIALTLLAQGSLSSYWRQSVVRPLQWAGEALEPGYWDTWNGLQRWLFEIGPRILPIFLAIATISWLGSRFQHKLGDGLARVLWIVRLLLWGGFFFYIAGALLLRTLLANGGAASFPERYLSLEPEPHSLWLYFLVFSFVVFFCVKGLLLLARFAQHPAHEAGSVGELLVWGLALAQMVQIVPTYDTWHVWWGVPLALVMVFSEFNKWIRPRLEKGAVILFMLALITTNSVLSQLALPELREVGRSDAFAAGTQAEPAILSELTLQQSVTSYLGSAEPRGPTLFMVRDGSVAGVSGEYLSDFADNVWWAGKPSTREIAATSWNTLVIDSWVWNFLGFSDIFQLAVALNAEIAFCTAEEEPTKYCVLNR